MLLAEALAARKDVTKEIESLAARLKAASVRYEDEATSGEDPARVLGQLGQALDRLEDLSVRINRSNNNTKLNFEDRELSVMEAIALRERLLLEAKARRGAVTTIEEATGSGRAARWPSARRAKDDLREIPTVDLREERRAADELSEKVRRLDLAVQQRNWTTELSE